jgi:predicted CXXCH cytochrome family protein
MRKKILYILVYALGACGFCWDSAPTKAAEKTTVSKNVCLECHGPFEKLIAAGATFDAENGDKINPHRYVPHNRKDEKSIVECAKCHKAHSLSPISKSTIAKADEEWCYSCHHKRDLSPCITCHP